MNSYPLSACAWIPKRPTSQQYLKPATPTEEKMDVGGFTFTPDKGVTISTVPLIMGPPLDQVYSGRGSPAIDENRFPLNICSSARSAKINDCTHRG